MTGFAVRRLNEKEKEMGKLIVSVAVPFLIAVALISFPSPSLGAGSTYLLNLLVTGPGGITVRAGGYSNQTCYGNCSYSYASNTPVTLTIEIPPVDYSFIGWGGACSGKGSCQFLMTAAKDVSATFADISSPDTAISSGYISPRDASPALFGFYFDDNMTSASSFECKVNNESWGPCTSPYNGTFVYPACAICRAETPMNFSVRAKDAAGNSDPTPATTAWTIYHPVSDAVENVQNGGEIQLMDASIIGDLTFSRAITLALRGGYSADYSFQTGITTISGVLTIADGTVVMDNIAIAQ